MGEPANCRVPSTSLAKGFGLLVLYSCPVIALLSSHMIFIRIRAYHAIWHLDSGMHFVGGIALGIAILGLLRMAQRMGLCGEISQKVEVFSIIGLVFIGAIGWEIFEWVLDIVVGTQWFGDPVDTAKDLVLGILGASILTILRWLMSKPDVQQNSAS
jgi:hypothetical protein